MHSSLWRLTFILISFIAVGPLTARSQTPINDVVVDKSGKCPPEGVLRTFPGVTLLSAGIGSTGVKLGNDTHLAQSHREGVGQTYVWAPFNTQLIVYGFNPSRAQLFVRLRPYKSDKAAPAQCGWISAERILLPRDKKFADHNKPQPLQMRDISGGGKASGNSLDVKAVIRRGDALTDVAQAGHVTESLKAAQSIQDPRERASALMHVAKALAQ